MAGRAATRTAINTTPPARGKATHRERLTAGMIAAANREGYAGATVSAVIEQAGVSRPTFYEHFTDRDDCFLQTVKEAQGALVAQSRRAVREAEPEQAMEAALDALVEMARSEPAVARFLTNEPLAAGRKALDARDRTLNALERLVTAAQEDLPDGAPVPALPASILFGAAHRLLGSQLRRGEPGVTGVRAELHDWVGRYEQARSQQDWQTREPRQTTSRIDTQGGVPSEIVPLPPGRPRLAPEEIAENHRGRILAAVAKLARSKGYLACTVADIATEAKLDTRVLYNMFGGKQEAFMAYHELSFQELMEATARGFFKGEEWPERSWEAGLAFTGFLAENPLAAHLGFVEAYAIGPRAVQRVEDSHIAFTMFLQEGYAFTASRKTRIEPPGRLALEAIVDGIYELVYREVRAGRAEELPRTLGQMAFLFLAPFLGGQETARFIRKKLPPRKRG